MKVKYTCVNCTQTFSLDAKMILGKPIRPTICPHCGVVALRQWTHITRTLSK